MIGKAGGPTQGGWGVLGNPANFIYSMRYTPCNCDMFILANSNSVMDTTYIYIYPQLYKTLKTVVAFSSWTLRWSMRFVHGGCIAAAGSSPMPARSIAKRKEKNDVWYDWQFSPILIYFACIISSCHDISSHCSQLQRDMQSFMHAWYMMHPPKLIENIDRYVRSDY